MLVTILLVVASSCIANGGSWHGKLYGNIRTYQDTYLLPDLPYKYTALQPYIDGKTLRVHHLGHHQAYTDKMNKLLKEWRREVRCHHVTCKLLIPAYYFFIFRMCEAYF